MKKYFLWKNIISLSFVFFVLSGFLVFAEETVQEVEQKIDSKQKQILLLKKEIKNSENKIKTYQGKGKSLKSEIINLNYQSQKLKKNILEKELTIENLEKTIQQLDIDLKENYQKQQIRRKNIGKFLIFINKFSNQNPLEILLVENSLASFTDTINAANKIKKNLTDEISSLKNIEKKLAEIKNKRENENKKVSQKKELLNDQKIIAEKNKISKKNLLIKTKNKEAYYQKLLTEKKKQIKAFYEDIYALESKLKILIDPASLPKPYRGLFGWPVPIKNLWITQRYGVTPWRVKNAGGTPHRGLDFGVTIGTPMYAIADGIISGTGDNEKVCKGVQYGKWITVDQQNNLSSLYAHLSMIKVQAGDKVKKGDIIGYSGNTGYSTGPHLHFAIFATKGMQIQKIKHRWQGRCYQKEFRLPIVAGNAYVNPINYMPKQ